MVERQRIRLNPDPLRVMLQFFHPGSNERANKIINRINNLDEEEVEALLEKILISFENRHRNFRSIIQKNYYKVARLVDDDLISQERKLLIGAYFTKEYSIEAAALFNPSIVLHPDQSNLRKGEVRFIISLRATGEGHISSIEFRTGVIDESGQIVINTPSRFASSGEIKNDKTHEFTYEVKFDNHIPIDERVLFPYSKLESNGIEDARFVCFQNSNKDYTYYATYTAYDGKSITINLLETKDFTNFMIKPLMGKSSGNKGMALFPRKINGKYAMISRIDGENLYFSQSDNIQIWDDAQIIRVPLKTWEFVQIGNCGSPIETEKGWILLTHGVGPVRSYVISAVLLNLDDPSKVIGYLPVPLINPNEEEREGYVPNVVYSCGAMVYNNSMIIPYALSDQSTSIATIPVNRLLENFVYQS